MFKRDSSKTANDPGADHLQDARMMRAIEKDMLKNIHRQIRSKWCFLKTAPAKYALAASVLLICTVSYLFLSKRPGAEKRIYVSALNGRLSVVNLPDGSTIWLNSGSAISYPEKFTQNREVQLINGEAFFDVKHDKAHPFIVHYGNLHTQVLGTSFNIKYYSKLNDVRITVVRGLVEVGNKNKSFGMLKPDKEIIYNQKSNTYHIRTINSQKVSAWKSKEINLYDVPFEDLMLVLENTYDIKIRYNHAAMKDVVTTIHFLGTDDLKPVLEMIAIIHGLNYTIAGKEVTLENN